MYVGVIRGDMPGPIFISDVEPLSQTNFPTEPFGQTAYISRPSVTALTNYLGGLDPDQANPQYQGSGGVPAGVEGTAAVTFPLTLTGSNNVIRVKNVSTASFTAFTIATGTYPTMANLLTAINAALNPAPGVLGIATATTDVATGTLVVIQSTVMGVGSYIAIDTTGNGSTFNTPSNFSSSGTSFTMPTAATIIGSLNPVATPPATGSINVSAANVLANLGASPAAQGAVGIICPHFTETLQVIQSFQVGVMSKFLELTYNPDPTLMPPLTNGPAIQCVQDNGTSAYSAPLPIITAAVHNSPNTGDITITGQSLGNSEYLTATEVRVTGVSPGPGLQSPYVRLGQHVIQKTLSGGTQGVVTPTSIVIPASLLNTTPAVQPGENLNPAPTGVALGVAGSTVEVQFSSLANTNYGTTASLTTVTNGVATLTGLSYMNANMVGGKITLSGCASSANNGTFFIASYVSASSVTITNPLAVASDGNNGSISWSQPAPILFVVT
jgi:hypothetical protein